MVAEGEEDKVVANLALLAEVYLPTNCSFYSSQLIYSGGAGYGAAGLSVANIHSGGNNPGGSAGNVYGDPELTILHLGSGGMHRPYYFPHPTITFVLPYFPFIYAPNLCRSLILIYLRRFCTSVLLTKYSRERRKRWWCFEDKRVEDHQPWHHLM